MKTRTIKSHLRWKVNQWIESITDPKLRELVAGNTIVTGGSIVSMLLKERVNDYDLYFRNIEVAHQVAEYYVQKFKEHQHQHKDGRDIPIYVERTDSRVRIMIKSAGVAGGAGTADYEYFETQPDEQGVDYVHNIIPDPEVSLEDLDEVPGDALDKGPKYVPVFMSDNAITLSHGIQLVIRFHGEPDEIHKFYDFDHCKGYWKSWDGELVLSTATLEAILTKELRYSGSLYPLCSIIRIRKFVARGWTINAGMVLKMCMQLNDLDLRNLEVLKDQLVGVDVAYFRDILNRLEAKQREDGTTGQPIDSSYLATIIDRLF